MEDIQAESLLKMDQPLQKVYERLDSKETEAILSMIKMHLELEGYLVMTATEGREALTQLSNAPDLILLDINMQGMNGIDLCSSIRDYISCPILFLTARVSGQDKVNGFKNKNASKAPKGSDIPDKKVKPIAFFLLLVA